MPGIKPTLSVFQGIFPSALHNFAKNKYTICGMLWKKTHKKIQAGKITFSACIRSLICMYRTSVARSLLFNNSLASIVSAILAYSMRQHGFVTLGAFYQIRRRKLPVSSSAAALRFGCNSRWYCHDNTSLVVIKTSLSASQTG